MPVQPLDAMIAFDPMTYGVTITAAQLSEVFEIHNKTSRGLQKILIAVDNEPVAAHAADIGMELSRELKAEMALVYVINGTVDYMGHAGISSERYDCPLRGSKPSPSGEAKG